MDAFNLQLTDKEHLWWGHEYISGRHPESFTERRDDRDKFDFELGRMSRKPMSFAEELRDAMTRLVDTHGTDLALFYSGGSDSEIVLRVLLDLGVKPEIHTIKFTGGLNSHETTYADELCKSFGLQQHIWHHDVERYIAEEQYLDLALRYQCSQIAYLTVLKHITFIDKTAIMGGEVYLQKHQKADGAVYSPTEWYYIYREDEDGVTYRYAHDTGHKVINEVLTYTPELLYAYLVHPEVAKVAANQVPGKITLLSIKRKVYEQSLGLELAAQTKFHGYERLQWTNIAVRNRIQSKLFRAQTARLEYKSLLQHLRGDLDV